MKGVQVLEQVGPNQFRADNTFLRSSYKGMVCRRSKNVEDQTDLRVFWGNVITGFDEGDGWVRLQPHQVRLESRETIPPGEPVDVDQGHEIVVEVSQDEH